MFHFSFYFLHQEERSQDTHVRNYYEKDRQRVIRGHGAGPLSDQTWVIFHKNAARRKTNKYEAKYLLILHLLHSFEGGWDYKVCVIQMDHLSINTSVKHFWAGHQTISLQMTDLMTPTDSEL